jgi:hypothetical protein
MDLWKNPFKYEIVFNNEVLYSNFNGTVSDQELIIFNDSGDAKIGIDHFLPKRVCLILEFTVLQESI